MRRCGTEAYGSWIGPGGLRGVSIRNYGNTEVRKPRAGRPSRAAAAPASRHEGSVVP